MTESTEELYVEAEKILGYRFNNPQLINVALTHASVADTRLQSNERMEFLGDAVLGMVVCEYLFDNYQNDLEGEMTKIKSAVVSRRVCAQISNEIGLTQLLLLGKGMNTRNLPMSLSAAVYEAIVAAIYLDGGLEPAREFILKFLGSHIIDNAKSTHQQNFKSVLQHYAQRHLTELPSYRLLDEKGPDHSKCFEVCVELGNHRYSSAWGQNKKQAEQRAALKALIEMQLAEEDDDGIVHLVEWEEDQ